jgi:glycerophosphoryl diester phosphodiesterase
VRRARTGLLLLLAACGAEAGAPSPEPVLCATPIARTGALGPFEAERFIAHAGGSPGGLLQDQRYSNSREAFEVSYANGFRAFELDLVLLADGEVIAAHDFHEEYYGLDHGSFPELTREDVEGARWNDRYDLLFAQDVIDLLVEHPDVWLVLDTKLDEELAITDVLLALAPDDGVRDRMVPHLASEAHAVALAERYPFPERMVAVYRWAARDATLVAAMERLGVDNIMMWWNRRWTEDAQEAFDEAGLHMWVHDPTEVEVIEDFLDRGVGIYSDGYITCGG